MNIIEINNLTKKYNSKVALQDINLNLPAGKIIGLLGPNGSGKTTLIKIISGLSMHYEGNVLVDGKKICADTKSIISYLPDSSYFGKWMKIQDAIDMFQDFFEDFRKEKAYDMLKRLELEPNMNIKTMSKGMVEKFQLTLTMSRKAKLYILDEPIGGVDPAARDYIIDTILSNYSEEGSILFSTHLIQDVERVFDHIVFLNKGKVVLDEEVNAIRERTQMSIDQLFREEFKC